MSHWWRAYDEALHDPKVIALNDRLHRAWFNLLCVASKNGGTLPAIATIAIELRVTVARAAEYLTALVLAGLIDEIELGKFAPHNWSARQFKSDVSTERVKRFRNGPRNVSSTVSETPPETDTERTDSETDTEISSLRSENACAHERAGFDEFWKAYPHKVGRKAAYKAFVVVMKSGAVGLERLLFTLAAYVNKTDDRPWCNPATWLNQGRWDDQPAPEVRSGNANSLLAAIGRQREKLGPSTVDYEPQLDPVLRLPSR